MYSIVYVLTDNKKLNFYYEMRISIYSLRKRNFSGNIFVLLDLDTRDTLKRLTHNELEEFNVQLVVVDVPEKYTKTMRSRYIKTSMRKWVKGDFLFLDTDTIVAEELPEVISEYDISLVLDSNVPCKDFTTETRLYNRNLLNRCGCDDLLKDDLLYFNSGVIWVKDTELVHKLFEGWHRIWFDYLEKRGVSKDQAALNQINKEMGGIIQRLSDLYNVQVTADPFPAKYLAEAKIIHYFHIHGKDTYMLASEQIDKSDLTNPLIQQIIDAPKTAFNLCILMRKSSVRENILLSKQYEVLYALYVKYPRIFNLGEKSTLFLLGLWTKVHGICRRLKKMFRMQ